MVTGTSSPATFPQGWTTLGHPGPSRLLLGALRAGRLSHAYLIAGLARTGRKTLALDLARAVNCAPAPDLFGAAPARPCGQCAQCSRITRGIHADVRVITVDTPVMSDRPADSGDPASGADTRHKAIRIGHIWDLERQAFLKPFEGAKRVFIIDGAELMSEEAANALLKTLEEPPPDVLLVLVATAPESVPQTILSRCHVIQLRPVPAEVIEQALQDRFHAPPEQARTLARLARGRPGWAINALVDPTALDRQAQAVIRITGAIGGGLEARFRYAREVADAFWRRRDDALLEMDLWLDWWRDVALVRHGLDKFVINIGWLPALTALGKALDDQMISSTAASVARTRRALEANAIPRLALDVMMLDLPGADPGIFSGQGEAPEGAAGSVAAGR